MKKLFIGIAAMFIAANVNAQTNDVVYDTTKFEMLNEVVVSGVRVQKDAPFAVTNIQKMELNDFAKTGQELPFLFAKTPGIIAWSENGIGTGTSYMRIRGAGDSRINVTLDGVALNSPEDQCVFWANMNSYGSLLGSVQIQRGVGTSTNGDGAFGGTVALSSATPSFVPSAEITGSYGSFNTLNFGAKASTGLLWNHLIIDGAYHETNTNGFVHGTQGRSGSYYGGITYVNNRFQLRYKNIGNFERTGQAWNGVTAGDNNNSLMDGMYLGNTGIKTYSANKQVSSLNLSENDTFRVGFYAVPEYNGMLYNGDMTGSSAGVLGSSGFKSVLLGNTLGDGAFVGYDFTVDDSAPSIEEATLSGSTLTIEALDNLNLAYVAVLSLDGETVYMETAPREKGCSLSLDISDAVANAAGYVAVFAGKGGADG